jgi:hypothetical protein
MLIHGRSPTEIQLQNDPGANIERLLAVANMSHKYSVASFETWALSIIWIHCQSARDYLNDCGQNMLDGIYGAAAAGGRRDLCSLVEQKWLPRLKQGGDLQLRHALDFGDAHDMRTFLGEAYYQQARDMKPFAPAPAIGSEVVDFSPLNLTPSQLHRLLSGYCSLSLFWEKFSSTVLTSCAAGNHSKHKSKMNDISSWDCNDPLNILEGLKRARSNALHDSHSCRRDYIDTLISGFSGANHFV